MYHIYYKYYKHHIYYKCTIVGLPMADIHKPTGWRISVELRNRITSWARGENSTAEKIVNRWLEERLLIEETKKLAKLGKPIKKG
jgi:hypothetical protein